MSEGYDLTVYSYLKSKLEVVYSTVRDDETQIRCPFCGDSQKSLYSAHLYIKNRSPFPYYCQRCTATGVVNAEFLMKIDQYDVDLNKYLNVAQEEYNRNLIFKFGTSASLFSNKNLIMTPNQYTDVELSKIEYIENRIGVPNLITTKEDLKKFNIVLNLTDFLTNNNFDLNSYEPFQRSKVNDLDKGYAMFLLNDKIMVNARNIDPRVTDSKQKFYKFRIINDDTIQSRRFYNINLPIDITNRVFNIHMTEGIFDILSIYNNGIVDTTNEDNNNIFVANNGKGYLFVLNHLQSLGILNCNINIYSDSDVSVANLKSRLYRSTIAKFNGINVFYNDYHKQDKNIKDFGVHRDKIILSKPTPVQF